MNTVGWGVGGDGDDRHPNAGSVLRFSIFSKFIIPNHINQNVSGGWESSLEEPLSAALVGPTVAAGNAKSGARGRLLRRVLFATL